MAGTFKACEGEIDFTKQELIFAALHHDLGKLGVPGTPYYLDQDSDWHRKRGELYKHNEQIQYMKVPDRAVFLLQTHGIAVTEAEYLSIKLSDVMYSDGNEAYLKNWTPYSMKTNLPYIIHWADHMATTIERDKSKF
jgi:CRISPR/Cas system-associated endonuclease Cas1